MISHMTVTNCHTSITNHIILLQAIVTRLYITYYDI